MTWGRCRQLAMPCPALPERLFGNRVKAEQVSNLTCWKCAEDYPVAWLIAASRNKVVDGYRMAPVKPQAAISACTANDRNE